ncbi:hypothetical protein [Flavobacterium sp. PL02]|uniref:hypothetical protein n=1 Tax=Flavobacterium sp. PL02 TaxID=3088354 RepID=UPI002B22C1F7|nr:hypothetical protein [Flavobacterium sp. PL02]MEA9415429.1 hypothetical protein [Flavobacterium sp. PL02]
MIELKKEIIRIFENRNSNFKKGFINEFKKINSPIQTPEMSKYKNLLIYDIYKEITDLPESDNVENLFLIIDETLFEHIGNSQN